MYPAGIPGITSRFVILDGTLRVRVLESGPAAARAVLLVHGWGASVYTFAENIPALVESGHRVVALDLPGHGLSDKPLDEAMYSLSAMGGVVERVVAAAGLRRFDLVGHSMGGTIGLDLARRKVPGLERLVLISAPGLGRVKMIRLVKMLSPSPVNRVLPLLLGRRTITAILRAVFAKPDRPRESDIDEYWAPTQFPEFGQACRACIHRISWDALSAQALGELRLPVLAIEGAHDRLVLGVGQAARNIPGATVMRISDGGHIVLQECAPETNEALIEFLRR